MFRLNDSLLTLISSVITTTKSSSELSPRQEFKKWTISNSDYLYRDAGNYKKWAEIVFSNPGESDTSKS